MRALSFLVVTCVTLPAIAADIRVGLCEGVAPSQSIMPTQSLEVGGITVWLPDVTCHGQLLVIAVETEPDCIQPNVLWQERRYSTFAVSQSQRHALLAVPLETKAGQQTLHLECGERRTPFEVRVAEATYPSSTLRVKKKYTRKPPKRTEKEREAIKEAFASTAAERLWTAGFVRPAPAAMTSPFGAERTYNGEQQSQHRGLDIDGRRGDPVVATNDGMVVLAAKDFYYIGNALLIDHGQSVFSVYFHMSRLAVKTGDRVTRGQRIGRIGATGRVTGPHLHFGVKFDGIYVDPEGLLAYQPRPVGAPMPGEVTGKSEPGRR